MPLLLLLVFMIILIACTPVLLHAVWVATYAINLPGLTALFFGLRYPQLHSLLLGAEMSQVCCLLSVAKCIVELCSLVSR